MSINHTSIRHNGYRTVDFCTEVGTLHKDEFYFVPADCNLLAKVNIITNDRTIVSIIPNEYFWKTRTIGAMHSWNNLIICIPLCGRSIYIYNLQADSWNTIELIDLKPEYNFFASIIVDEKLYIFGYLYERIASIKLLDFTCEYIDISSRNMQITEPYFGANCVRYGDEIIVPIVSENAFMCFNYRNNNISKIELKCKCKDQYLKYVLIVNKKIFFITGIEMKLSAMDLCKKYEDISVSDCKELEKQFGLKIDLKEKKVINELYMINQNEQFGYMISDEHIITLSRNGKRFVFDTSFTEGEYERVLESPNINSFVEPITERSIFGIKDMIHYLNVSI